MLMLVDYHSVHLVHKKCCYLLLDPLGWVSLLEGEGTLQMLTLGKQKVGQRKKKKKGKRMSFEVYFPENTGNFEEDSMSKYLSQKRDKTNI